MDSRVLAMLARMRRKAAEASSLISPFGRIERRIAASGSRKSISDMARAVSSGNLAASSRNCCLNQPATSKSEAASRNSAGARTAPGASSLSSHVSGSASAPKPSSRAVRSHSRASRISANAASSAARSVPGRRASIARRPGAQVLLRRRTTCAPGRRAMDALRPGTDRAALEAAFALIREAREWLRTARELGFGALADPDTWLERLEAPGAVLAPAEFLDAASLLEVAGWFKQQFREEAAKFPLLTARAMSLMDFREPLAAIRRSILPNGEISDDASPALRRIRASIASTRE